MALFSSNFTVEFVKYSMSSHFGEIVDWIPQNQRLKNLTKIFRPLGLLRALLRAFYLLCSGKSTFMFDLKACPQLPGGYTFGLKKKLPPCSTPENL
jgi:hypothetical protein